MTRRPSSAGISHVLCLLAVTSLGLWTVGCGETPTGGIKVSITAVEGDGATPDCIDTMITILGSGFETTDEIEIRNANDGSLVTSGVGTKSVVSDTQATVAVDPAAFETGSRKVVVKRDGIAKAIKDVTFLQGPPGPAGTAYTAGAGIAIDTSNVISTDLATSDGNAPNAGSNLVHWDNIVGMPAEFADGIDNTGAAGGGVSMVHAGTGVSIAGTAEDPKVNVVFGAAAGEVAEGDHGHTLAGDAAGALEATVVGGIHGRLVAATAPADGQVLKWNDGAAEWQPADETGVVYTAGAGIAIDAGNVISTDAASVVVDWSNITGMPADFADGIDNTGAAGGGVSAVHAGTGVSIAGTAEDPQVNVVFGAAAGEVAEGDHTHTLAEGATDVTATAAELNLLAGLSGTIWTGDNDGADSGLDADMLDGLDSTDFAAALHDHTLAGDVTGGTGATVVTAIRGGAVSATAPAAGQVLKWDGTQWAPSDEAAGGVASVTANAPLSATEVAGDVTLDLALAAGGGLEATWSAGTELGLMPGTADGQILKWNDSGQEWVLDTDLDAGTLDGLDSTDFAAASHGHTLAGDVTGGTSATVVTAIRGGAISATAPADGQVLRWVDAASQWSPSLVNSAMIADGTITNEDISATTTIAASKIEDAYVRNIGDTMTGSLAINNGSLVVTNGNILSDGAVSLGGGGAAQAYNRVGSGTSGWGLTSSNDLLVTSSLEVGDMLVGWGDTYLAGNVDINGPAWIDNDISVYGPANFMGGAEVSDQLTVNGPTVLGDSLEVYNGAVAFGALDVYGSVTATSPDGGTPALNVDGPGMYGACISMGNDTWRIAQDQTSNDLLFVKSSGTTFTPLRLMDESFNDAIVAAAGGVGIGKSNPATMLDVNGTVTATGLTATGSLSLPTGSVTSAFILDGGVQAADLNDGVTTRAWQQITFDDSYPFIGPDPYFWGLYGLSQIEITPPRAGGYFVLTFTGTFYDSMGPTTTPVDGHFHLCHRSQAGMVNILPYVGDPLYVNVGDPFGTPTYKYQFNVHITRTLPNVWGSGQQTFCLFGWDTAWYDDWSFGGTFTVEWKPGSATQQSWP